jgi:hypothetical protein
MELDHHWRKSTYSGATGSASCVEAGTAPGAILVRDTTQHGTGPVLHVTPTGWKQFTETIKG